MSTEIKDDSPEQFFSSNLKEEFRKEFEQLIANEYNAKSHYLGSLKIEDEDSQRWNHYFRIVIVGEENERYVELAKMADGSFCLAFVSIEHLPHFLLNLIKK